MFGLGRLALAGLAILVPAALGGAGGNAPGDLDLSFMDEEDSRRIDDQPDGKILLSAARK